MKKINWDIINGTNDNIHKMIYKRGNKRYYNYNMNNYGYNFRIYTSRNSSNMNQRNRNKQRWTKINRIRTIITAIT